MTTVATLTKSAAMPTKRGVAAAGNAAAESIGAKLPRKQMAALNIQRVATVNKSAEVEEARSLNVLWNITLGMLIYAVVAAIFTLIISS
jgi:hypothetical protein